MAGYTRQSSSNIQPGEIVKSGPVNNEFNAIRDAFNKTSGHKHDGSTAEGAFISTLADSDGLNKIVIDTSNNRIGFFSEVSSAAVEQIRIQDGAIVPVTDNDIDLGASGTEFKDLFIDGTATIDTLTVDESATITANLTVNGNTTLGNAASDTVTLTADVASAITPSADDTHDLGAVGSEWRNLYVDGQALIDDLVADTADINGGTIDGVTIGGSSAGAGSFTTIGSSGLATLNSLTVTGATALNGGLTMDTNKFTVADTSGNTAIAGTLDVTGQTTVANFTATGTTVLPATSFGDANITNVGNIALDSISADGSTITITGNTTFADGSFDFNIASHDGTNGLALGGTVVTASAAELNKLKDVTSTTAEINILDGDTSATSTTVADADRVILNDNGTMVQVAVTDLAAYFDDEITAMPNLVSTGALDSGSITSGFGTINTGSSTITTTGNITGGNLIISDGGNIGSSSDTDAISIASGGNVTMSQNLTVTGDLTVSGTTTTVNSTTVTIDDPVFTIGGDTAPSSDDNKDRGIEFRYHTGSAAKVGFFGFDDSTGKFTFIPDATNNSEVFSGTAGTIVANLEGAVTGNASTATALASAVTIAGKSFDGTGNIAIAPTDLTSVTATAAELNILDGDTSATSTTIVSADRVVLNDDGTMKQVSVDDLSTFLAGDLGVLTNVTSVGALNTGSITSGFGSINNGSSGITSSGTIEFGSLSDGTVTVTDIADEDNFSSNSATKLATQQSIKAYVDSTAGQANNVTNLTATGVELNTVADFSAVSVDTSTAIASNDAILMFDNGNEIGYRDVDLLDTYFSATTKTLTNKTLTSPTVSGLYLSDAGITIEGSSANDHETVLNVTDPTADRTITFPDATGTVALSNSSSATFGGNGSSSGVTLADGLISIRTGTGSVAAMRFYCEVNNAHYVELKAPAHSAFSGNLSFTLPSSDGSNGQVLKTNGSGQLSFATISTDLVNDTSPQLGGNLASNGNDIQFADNDKANFGTGSDLQIYHDGSNSYIDDAGTGNLNIRASANVAIDKYTGEAMARFYQDAGVFLYHNNAAKFETDQYGITVTGRVAADALTVDEITIDGDTITATDDFIIDVASDIKLDANGGYINFFDDGTPILSFQNSSTDAVIQSRASDRDLIFKGNDNGSTITALTLDMSDAGTAIFNHDIKLGDGGIAKFGAGDDLLVYHSGSQSYVQDGGTGSLNLLGSTVSIGNADATETMATFATDGAATLYHNNSSKLATTANGINVSGDVVVTNDIYVADQIIHEGDTDTYLQFHNANEFRIVTGGTEMLEINDTAVQFGAAGNLNGNNLTNVEDIYLRDKIFHDGNTDTRIGFAVNEIQFSVDGEQEMKITTGGVFLDNAALNEDYDALSGTTPTISTSAGGMFSLTMSGNTTFTFQGATSGYAVGFILQLTGNGGTVTYPNTVDFAGGTAPDAPANGETDILVFITRDGGTTWYGALAIDAAG